MGPKSLVYVGSADVRAIDVGGEFTDTRDDVVIALEEDGVGIRMAEAQLNPDGTLQPVHDQDIALDAAFDQFVDPAISRTNGSGQFVIAFRDAVHSHIFARATGYSGHPMGAMVQAAGGGGSRPSVDGNGTDFVVVWEADEPVGTSNNIRARRVSWNGSGLDVHGPSKVIVADPGVNETAPAVAYTGLGYTLAWLSDSAVRTATLDPIDLTVSGEVGTTSGNTPHSSVEVTSRYSGGDSGTPAPTFDAMVIWRSGVTGDLDIEAAFAQTDVAIPYCTAKVNSCGTTPFISYAGSPSAGAVSGFSISGMNAKTGTIGVLVYTQNGRDAIPFDGGTLCVSPPVNRGIPTAAAGGTPMLCDASYSLDMNCFASGFCGGAPAAYLGTVGQTVNAQWWGRDTVAHGSYLSNALEYVQLP